MRAQDPGDRFAAIAHQLHEQPSLEATTERIVELAVEVVPGCDHAGLSLVEHRKINTVAATDDLVAKGDRRQYVLNEGPCLDTIRDEETIRSPRLAVDDRWPAWAPWVDEHLGVQSILCFQLFTSEHFYGALNLYSGRTGAFDSHDEAVGATLAAHASVAIETSRTIATLNNAVSSRTVIGQAEGMLMERFGLTPEQAFSVLVRVSQNENRRLALVAEELVKTRRMPGSGQGKDADRP